MYHHVLVYAAFTKALFAVFVYPEKKIYGEKERIKDRLKHESRNLYYASAAFLFQFSFFFSLFFFINTYKLEKEFSLVFRRYIIHNKDYLRAF